MGTLRAPDPAPGTPAEVPFAPVWRMRGGQAVWWRCDEDTTLLHRARGAL